GLERQILQQDLLLPETLEARDDFVGPLALLDDAAPEPAMEDAGATRQSAGRRAPQVAGCRDVVERRVVDDPLARRRARAGGVAAGARRWCAGPGGAATRRS